MHQTTPATEEDRYPALFALAADLNPHARCILSFGCSTGAEIAALRRRFPDAEIVGAEINRRSRRIAARRLADDTRVSLVAGRELSGGFDAIFAMAVFQREPHKVEELDVQDLSRHYPFDRFDRAVRRLLEHLNPGGLLCVTNAHYRVEDTSAAAQLERVAAAPLMDGLLFAPDGRRLDGVRAGTMFRKIG